MLVYIMANKRTKPYSIARGFTYIHYYRKQKGNSLYTTKQPIGSIGQILTDDPW